MIARNFYERSPNILYPTVDVAGEKTGIVGCEFPLLNYLIYLTSLVFGFENWFGRLINLIISSLGVFYFYKLIRSYFGESSAFCGAIVLLVSMWFTYSRKNMPDTFAASLCIAGLFFAFQYLEEGRWHQLMLFFTLGCFGCLSKISASALLTVLAVPLLMSKYSWRRKLMLVIPSSIILVAVYAWYFYWVPYLNSTYEYSMFFMGMPMATGAKELYENWPSVLAHFYDTPLKFTGFAVFAMGIFFLVKDKSYTSILLFLIPFCFFIIVMLKSGLNFVRNEYYMLIITPTMAFVAGRGLAYITNKKIAAMILVMVGIEGVANKVQDFRIRQPFKVLEEIEMVMDKISKRADLIAINGGAESGTAMFMSHRRGWRVLNNLLLDPNYLSYLKSNQCKYIVVLKKDPWVNVDLSLQIIYDSEYYKIYKLD
jgi:hypothetical protein